MDMPLENFKAATKFLYNFKKKHLIVSRKITKIISREHVAEKIQFQNTADSSVKHVRNRSQKIQQHNY
jgi:hypothetical protein